jgi:hypothetical protein
VLTRPELAHRGLVTTERFNTNFSNVQSVEAESIHLRTAAVAEALKTFRAP